MSTVGSVSLDVSLNPAGVQAGITQIQTLVATQQLRVSPTVDVKAARASFLELAAEAKRAEASLVANEGRTKFEQLTGSVSKASQELTNQAAKMETVAAKQRNIIAENERYRQQLEQIQNAGYTEKQIEKAKEFAEQIHKVNLKNISEGFKDADEASQKFNDSTAVAIVGLQTMAVVAQSVFSAIKGIATEGVKTFIQFDNSIQAFKALGGGTAEQVKAVSDEAKRLGADTSKTASETAAAAVELSKLGFSADQVSKELAGLVQLSEASGASVETSAKIIGAGSNVYQRSADDIADITAQMANLTAADANDFLQVISKAGAVAKTNNQDLETLAAAFGLLRSAGFTAETAATGVKTAINRLAAPSSTHAKNAITEIGVQIRDTDGKMRNMMDLVPEFRAAFAEIEKNQGAGASYSLARTIFGDEGGPAFLALMATSQETINRTYEGIKNSAGSASTVSEKLMGGIGGTIKRFTGAVDSVKQDIGETLAPAVIVAAQAAYKFLSGFLQLPGPIKAVTYVAVGLTAAVSGMALAYATLTTFQVLQTAATVANTAVQAGNNIVKGVGLAAQIAYGVATTNVTTAMIANTAATAAGIVKTAALGVATSASGVAATFAAGGFGALASAMLATLAPVVAIAAPLAVLAAGIGVVVTQLEAWKLEQQNLELDRLRKDTELVGQAGINSAQKLVDAEKVREQARINNISLTQQQLDAEKKTIAQATQTIKLLEDQKKAAEAVPVAKAGFMGIGKQEAEAQNAAREAAIKQIDMQISQNNRLKDNLLNSVKADEAKAKSQKNLVKNIDEVTKALEKQSSQVDFNLNKTNLSIEQDLADGKITDEQAKELKLKAEKDSNNKLLEINRNAQKDLAKIRELDRKNAIEEANQFYKERLDQINKRKDLDEQDKAKLISQAQNSTNEKIKSFDESYSETDTGKKQQDLANEEINIQREIAQAKIESNKAAVEARQKEKDEVLKIAEEQKEKSLKITLKGIEEELAASKSSLDKRAGDLQIKGGENQLRQQELQSEVALNESLNKLDEQRLNYQLELANRSGDTVKAEEIKGQLLNEQQQQLDEQTKSKQEGLKIANEQKQIELELKEISAQVALLEAQANLEKAKANGASQSEIESLTAIVGLRQLQISAVDKEKQSVEKIKNLENERFGVDTKISQEALNQKKALQEIETKVAQITKAYQDQRDALENQSKLLGFQSEKIAQQSAIYNAKIKLIELESEAQESQLNFQKELASRAQDSTKVEQLKTEEYLNQREQLQQQHESQKVSLALSYEQEKIGLRQKEITSQINLLEAQANLEKAKANGATGEQLKSLEKAVEISQMQVSLVSSEKATSEQINQVENERIDKEISIKNQQLEQNRILQLQDAQIGQINEKLESQRALKNYDSELLTLQGQELNRQTNLLNAQSSLSEAQIAQDQQRLNYQLEVAKLQGDSSKEEQLKSQIYEKQKQAVLEKQQIDRESLKISQEQKAIDLERQKIAAEISLLESQAKLEEAKVLGVSGERLAGLERIAKLKQKALDSVNSDIANQDKINELENKRLGIQQQTAIEQLEQSKTLEDMRKQQEALNASKNAEPGNKSSNANVYAGKVYSGSSNVGGGSGEFNVTVPTNRVPTNNNVANNVAPAPKKETAQEIQQTIKKQEIQQTIKKSEVDALNINKVDALNINEVDALNINKPVPNPAPKKELSVAEAQARLDGINQKIDAYIANFNNEAEQEIIASGMTAEQATAGGYQQAGLARQEAEQIRADLASGALKTTGAEGFTPEQVRNPVDVLNEELKAAQKAVDDAKKREANSSSSSGSSEKSDDGSIGSKLDAIIELISEKLAGNNVENLVIVSSDPTGDARQVLNDLNAMKSQC